jgi:hypothetical protein
MLVIHQFIIREYLLVLLHGFVRLGSTFTPLRLIRNRHRVADRYRSTHGQVALLCLAKLTFECRNLLVLMLDLVHLALNDLVLGGELGFVKCAYLPKPFLDGKLDLEILRREGDLELEVWVVEVVSSSSRKRVANGPEESASNALRASSCWAAIQSSSVEFIAAN